VQLAYAIGVAEPVSVFIEDYGTSKLPSHELVKRVRSNFRLKPSEIVEQFDLLRPIYKATASYGHFGRSEFPWERLDKVASLKAP
jgi:S-adenosylmethionine synthetase